MSESTADRFIAVMAKLKAIHPPLEDPMRHQIRGLKESAYRIIDNAIREADQLAWLANDMSDSCQDAIGKALEIAATPTSEEKNNG